MAKKQAYGNESITTLKGAERVRKRPAVIFGSDGLDGCEHAVFEILSNAIDEAREGYGKLIIVTRYADRSIEVEDFGRGCPVDWNEKEQRYNWELVFCEMYAGGKYNNNASENYEYSLGLNGLGTCATQYASEYFNARVFRDGFEYHLHFKKGEIDIPVEYYLDTLKRQAVVNAGVTFRFRNQAGSKFETTEFCYEHGILDYITELTDGNAFTMPQYWETERRGRDRADKPEYKVKITAALCFSRNLSRLEYYHNSSWLEHGGAPDKAARSGFVSAIDAYLKQNGKYAKNESKITFQDVADCLVLVTNCFSTQTSYENQTKKSINNRFIQEAMTEFFRSRLQVYFLENKQEADRIAEQVLINKRSRETAERARITVKKKLSGNLDIANRVQKFVDCRSRDASRRELYIVEGDSAMGSVKLSRDAEFQGIMHLLRVMGCGVEVRDKHVKDLTAFDLGSLRWNKIVICTDADYDGFQIRTLVLTMLYRLVPTLIREGYVYIAETPLFEITCKDKTWFAYNETEKADILKKLEGKKISVARSKGLGENEPEMMWLTTMNPETRRLIKVMPEDAEKTAFYFDLLLGDNLAGRKEYIAENGSQYLEMADIS